MTVDPSTMVTIEAGIILDMLATIRRLHMGTDQGYRHPPCGVCHLVTEVTDKVAGWAPLPPPVPVPKPRLHLTSLPPGER